MHNRSYIKYWIGFFVALVISQIGVSQVNYVRTWDAMAPEQDPTNLITRPLKDVKQTTQYFDGLGRPIQTVIKQGSLATPSNPNTTSSPVDFVSLMAYDEFGREVYKYLPFVANSTGGNSSINDGLYKTNPLAQQQYFLQQQYGSSQGENGFYYSQSVYEPSPLNRVSEVAAPGSSWAGTMGNTTEANRRSVKTKYSINTIADGVRIWNVQDNAGSLGSYTSPGAYEAGSLYKNITVDETNHQVIEFKDKEGQVLLKKVQLGAAADNGSGSNHDDWLCTYYIYDDLNNLRCVIQPSGVALIKGNWQLSDATILAEQCFRYEYDERQRMIIKKVPGAGEVSMVYDHRDRLAYTQDANMRSKYQWLTTLYDKLNRPVMTGMITYANSRQALQDEVNYNAGGPNRLTPTAVSPIEVNMVVGQREAGRENYKASSSISFTPGFSSELNAKFTTEIGAGSTTETFDVSDNPMPQGVNFIALTITWYDSYRSGSPSYNPAFNSRVTDVAGNYPEDLPATSAEQQGYPTQGLVMGTKVRVLEDANDISKGIFLATTNFYDSKGRVIQVQSDNYKGGVSIVTNRYDFSGKVLSTYVEQNNKAAEADKKGILTKMTYDDLGRILKVDKLIYEKDNTTASGSTTLLQNEYNELGQLKRKTLDPVYNNNQGLEKIDYDYNIRGWLLGANRDYARDATGSTGKHFGFDLGYDKVNNNLIGAQQYAAPQYNGNIAGMVWKAAGDKEKRKYDFTYDAVNRLTGADFNQYSGGVFDKSAGLDFTANNLTYDVNGNILSMDQKGWKPGGSNYIDQLRYFYETNSNKLKKVQDLANLSDTKLGDFHTSSYQHTQPVDYSYDANGNLTKDLNKEIGDAGTDGITYNHLNLPWQIKVKNGTANKGTITYIYDATGNKWQKKTEEEASAGNNQTSKSTTTDYVGGFIYENNQLQFFGQEEGRIRYKAPVGSIPAKFVFDYFLKDHLGNVRMILTDEVQQDKYPTATLEAAKLATEKNYYDIKDAQVVDKTEATGITDYVNDNGIGNTPPDATFSGANSTKLYKLNSNTAKTGLGITLKVMAGDKIDVFGKSYYFTNTSGTGGNNKLPILDLLAGFLSASGSIAGAGAHGVVTAAQINTTTGVAAINSMITDRDNQNNVSPNKPRAFINVLFFDEQFKAFDYRISSIGDNSVVKDHFSELQNLIAGKNGYVYIYCSNESPIDVFFDNVQVVHTRGPLLEETHYYPFGLTMAGISSKALAFGGSANKYKFNGGNELQSKEFSDGSGLETYDAVYRMYDPQIGRFMQIDALDGLSQEMSLYAFGSNNPILRNDPLGLKDTVVNGEHALAVQTLQTVVVTPQNNKARNVGWGYWPNYKREDTEYWDGLRGEYNQQRDKGIIPTHKKFRRYQESFGLQYQATKEWKTNSIAAVLLIGSPVILSTTPIAGFLARPFLAATGRYGATAKIGAWMQFGNAGADLTYQTIKSSITGDNINIGSTLGNLYFINPLLSSLPGAVVDPQDNFLQTWRNGAIGDMIGNIPVPGLRIGSRLGLEGFTLPLLGNLFSDVFTGGFDKK